MVTETGADPVTALLLVSAGGAESVALNGAAAALLRRVVGLDVVVRGRLTNAKAPVTPRGARMFDVDEFIVRTADGIEAHDGRVVASGDGFGLRTRDGVMHPVPHMPAALREKPGARVFLTGRLDRAPVSYGVIEDAK